MTAGALTGDPLGADPASWLAAYTGAHAGSGSRARLVTTADLTTGGELDRQHGRLVADGATSAMAGTWLAGWFAGLLATAVGHVYALTRAGLAPSRESTSWVLAGGGWASGLRFSPDVRVIVAHDHPWSGARGVVVADGRDDLLARTADALVDAASPIVDHLAARTRAGRVGLWHAVGDALPMALTWPTVEVTADLVDDVAVMLGRPSAPWRPAPVIERVDTADGPVCVEHRGGCCLAFLHSAALAAPADAALRAYEDAFPVASGDRRYCMTCSLRTFEDARERQLWWRRSEALMNKAAGAVAD